MRAPLSNERLSALIASLYDCALDPRLWPDALAALRRDLDFANANVSLISMTDGRLLLNVASGMPPEYLATAPQYGADVIELWGGAERIRSYSRYEPLVLSRIRDRSEWKNNRFYVEWGRPQGIHDTMALALSTDPNLAGSMGLGRHDDKGEIGQIEIETARLLMPHVQRAVAISNLLDLKSIEATSFGGILDLVAIGILLVDAELRVVHANEAAERMIAAGSPFRIAGGYLAVRSRAVADALGAAVQLAARDEAAIGRRGLGIPVVEPDGGRLLLHVLPLRRGALRPALMPRAVAAIFISSATAPAAAPVEALAALYDLTPAEARVFALIAGGSSRVEAAKGLGVGASTVKSHLDHIFDKTGARRQSDLVKLGSALSLPLADTSQAR